MRPHLPMDCSPIRTYQGTGVLQYRDGASVSCEFSASQEHDGELRLTSTTHLGHPPGQWAAEAFDVPDRNPLRFSGQTEGGLAVLVEGSFLKADFSLGGTSTFVWDLSGPRARVQVGQLPLTADGEFRFAVANLLFDGSDDRLDLVLGDVPVQLRHAPDLEARRRALKRRHAIQVTAEAVAPVRLGFDDARQTVSDLSDLWSLAAGTFCNWVYCDYLSPSGERAFSFHVPAVTRGYSGGLPLIHLNDRETKAFVERSFAAYRELRESREFRTIVQAICEVRGQGYLDTRALLCVCLVEFILGIDARIHGGLTILPEEVFEPEIPRLQREVAEGTRRVFPDVGEVQIQQLSGHVKGFNWTSPRSRLKRMAKRLGITLTKNDVQKYLDTRNELVHRLRFHTEDRWSEFTHLVSVLDRLILGLLRYPDAYIDVRTFDRVASALTGRADLPAQP